jgi:hypothetical protein
LNLPLIIGARPPYCKAGAQVPLLKGEWEITVHGLIDTVISLWSDRPPTSTLLTQEPLRINGSRNVRVYIKEPGREEHISVYARRLSVHQRPELD